MIEHIRRRGPDHEGEFSKNKIHLEQLDYQFEISKMEINLFHEDINFITVFNGEIYNYTFKKLTN